MIYRQPGQPIRVDIREEIPVRHDYPETPYISIGGLLAIGAFYSLLVALVRACM
jgi:hypothetical protein